MAQALVVDVGEDAGGEREAKDRSVMGALSALDPSHVKLWQAAYYGGEEDFRLPYCKNLLDRGLLDKFRTKHRVGATEYDPPGTFSFVYGEEEGPLSEEEALAGCVKVARYDKGLFEMPEGVVSKGGKLRIEDEYQDLSNSLDLDVGETYAHCSRRDITRQVRLLRDDSIETIEALVAALDDEAVESKEGASVRAGSEQFDAALARFDEIERACDEAREAFLSRVFDDERALEAFTAQLEGLTHPDRILVIGPTSVIPIIDRALALHERVANANPAKKPCVPEDLGGKGLDALRCKGERYAYGPVKSPAEKLRAAEQMRELDVFWTGTVTIDEAHVGDKAIVVIQRELDGGDGFDEWLFGADEPMIGPVRTSFFNARGERALEYKYYWPG